MKKLIFTLFMVGISLSLFSNQARCEEKLMPDIKEHPFKCDGKTVKVMEFVVNVTSEGRVSALVNWGGKAEKVNVKLLTPDGKSILAEKTGVSPLELSFNVPKSLLKEQGNDLRLSVSPLGGRAEGKVKITIPVSERREKTGSDPDKGEMITKKPRGLVPKGKAPSMKDLKRVKKPPKDETKPDIKGKNLKGAPDKFKGGEVTQKVGKEAKPVFMGRHAIIRMEIIGDKITPVSGAILEEPLVFSPVVAGSLIYEVAVGNNTVAIETFPDPRYSRTYLDDGSVREGFFESTPRYFKVSIPEEALDKRMVDEMVINVYSIPGELGLEEVDLYIFSKVKKDLKLISSTEPGAISKVLFK